MKTISGVVTELAVAKTGEKNGKKWTLYTLKVNGLKFSCFDNRIKTLENQHADLQYEETQNGQYTNRTIVWPKANERQAESSSAQILRSIDKTLKEILACLETQKIDGTTEDVGPPLEEDMPNF